MMNYPAFYRCLALLLFSTILACAPSSVSIKDQELSLTTRNLGERYLLEGDYSKAIKEFNKAEKFNPYDHITQKYLGLAFLARARNTRNPTSKNQYLDLAEKYFKKSLELKPDFSDSKNSLGNVYLAQKKWDAAIQCYKEVLKDLVYATPYFPLSNLGWAYYNKKEYSTAEKYYLDALNLEPRFLLAMLGLGRTYIAMGKNSDATGVLEKAAEVYPKTPEVYLDLAKAYQAAHNNTKALNAYHKVLELAPNSHLSYTANKEINRMKR